MQDTALFACRPKFEVSKSHKSLKTAHLFLHRNLTRFPVKSQEILQRKLMESRGLLRLEQAYNQYLTIVECGKGDSVNFLASQMRAFTGWKLGQQWSCVLAFDCETGLMHTWRPVANQPKFWLCEAVHARLRSCPPEWLNRATDSSMGFNFALWACRWVARSRSLAWRLAMAQARWKSWLRSPQPSQICSRFVPFGKRAEGGRAASLVLVVCPCQSHPSAPRRRSRHGRAAAALICQSNRGKNLKMPIMPKSVQFRKGSPGMSTFCLPQPARSVHQQVRECRVISGNMGMFFAKCSQRGWSNFLTEAKESGYMLLVCSFWCCRLSR
jgi:hypothetical protein